MKKKLVYFPEWVIVDYLSNYKGTLQTTTNIEMLGALAMIKFCERQFVSKCTIGFDIQERHERELPNTGQISEKDFDTLVKEKIKTDSPIDFSIGKPDTKHRMDFQMKRFGKTNRQKTSQDLIDYINKLATKYGKTGCNLVILLESCAINPVEVSEKISIENYPFDKIILLNQEDAKYIDYTGIWAKTGETGTSRLNLDTMTFEY